MTGILLKCFSTKCFKNYTCSFILKCWERWSHNNCQRVEDSKDFLKSICMMKIFPSEYLFFLAKYVTTRSYIENLLKVIWRTSIIKRKLYKSLHQNHEESDFEELEFRMEFKMIYNASQRQYHVFHMVSHIQIAH